jgi:hypothetical protein
MGTPNGAITNLVVSTLDSDIKRFGFDWDDTHHGYVLTLLNTDLQSVISSTLFYGNTYGLPNLPTATGYSFMVQGFDVNHSYSLPATILFNSADTLTSLTAPTVDVEGGVIRFMPLALPRQSDKYEFKHSLVNTIGTAKDGASGSVLVIPNTVAGATHYIWYRQSSPEGFGDWIQTTVVSDEQSLFTWEAYASSDTGTGITLTKGDTTFVGLSAGHTVATPSITDPSIYNWVPNVQGVDWETGTGAPDGSLGRIGTKYLAVDTGDVYVKSGASAWTLEGNLRGGDGDQWFSGAANPPSDTLGDEGDNYLVTGSGQHYVKTGGTWIFTSTLKGTDGEAGVNIETKLVSDNGYFFKNNTGAVKTITAQVFLNGVLSTVPETYDYNWTTGGQQIYVSSGGDFISTSPSGSTYPANPKATEGLNFQSIQLDFSDVTEGDILNLTCEVTEI